MLATDNRVETRDGARVFHEACYSEEQQEQAEEYTCAGCGKKIEDGMQMLNGSVLSCFARVAFVDVVVVLIGGPTVVLIAYPDCCENECILLVGRLLLTLVRPLSH